eukprot:CAMPEP_0171112974 /NCGR_PEP_ID=MMETSP0766_2-20121228/80903_1 /TAXON_ID=439317 /ORGANISM="Gambierdiscus australes, Strain CAWD 149" /LENGTH=37 /DNA_ID= /DNA_START= /DNA_END= /DNA_ORIENTATION=
MAWMAKGHWTEATLQAATAVQVLIWSKLTPRSRVSRR